MADDLNTRLLKAAKAKVGKEALMKTGYGVDCFVLVDQLLRDLGAETAADGTVAVTPTADYDWGDGIISPEPGDILQFTKHFIKIVTVTKNSKGITTKTVTLTRGHHTAIVVAVHKDGSVTVIEQNVHPNPNMVNQNVIPRLDATKAKGETTKTTDGNDEVTTTMTVTGSVKAWRPRAKEVKGASLSPPGKSAPLSGTRMAGNAPFQGGAKRVPGPVGMEQSWNNNDKTA